MKPFYAWESMKEGTKMTSYENQLASYPRHVIEAAREAISILRVDPRRGQRLKVNHLPPDESRMASDIVRFYVVHGRMPE